MRALARGPIFAHVILALSSLCGTGGLALADDRIDGYFRAYDQPGVPGASVAVIKDGAILYERGYGTANLEENLPADATTNYRLASVTKQFTAMAIMVLKERGLLSYETALTDLLPSFPAYGRRITVRHLLNHTSGLRDYEELIPSDTRVPLKDSDVVAILARQSSTYFEPGTQYRYSNSGYATLSHIVSIVSGERFSTFLQHEIFEPLAMSETVAFEDGLNVVNERAYGYTQSGGRFTRTDQSLTSAVLGDGGVYTSVREYAQWDAALYTEKLVSASTLAEAFTSGRTRDGRSTGYGFGWRIDSFQGTRRVSHTGSTIGFRTAVQRFPDKRLTVIVLINRAGSAPWDIAEQIATLYL